MTTTTTGVRPDDLPALAERTARHPNGWHDVIDATGKPVTLKGRIESVAVLCPRPAYCEDSFQAPFTAAVRDGQVTLGDARHMSSYPLRDVNQVTVQYAEPMRSTVGGIAMVVGGGVILAPTAYALVVGIAAQGGEYSGIGRALIVFGLVGLAGSAALTGPGIVLIANDRQTDPRKSERSTTALELVPGGARVRVDFY